MKTSLRLVALSVGVGCALGGFAATKPIARWSFDDSANLGKDSQGGNDLTAAVATPSYNTPAQIADGKFSGACDLKRTSGTVGNAMVAKPGKLPTGNDPFTVCAWIRPNSASSSTAYLLIHQQLTGGVPGGWTDNSWNGWYLRFGSATQLSLCFGGWQAGTESKTSNVIGTVPNTVYKDGKWHLVAVSRDTNNLAKVYLDGVLLASKTVTTVVNADSVFRIGSYEKGNYFSGDYDEIKAWNVALSDEEILREYKIAKIRTNETVVDGSADLSDVDRIYGEVSGEGTLTFGGVGYEELLAPLTFGGTYRAYSAIVDLGYAGTAQAVPAESKLDLACTGGFNVLGDTTVAGLSGEGVLAAVNVAEGTTLTVDSDEDAVLNGRIDGAGAVVKAGSGSLTVKGSSSVKSVTVNAGTLAVGKPVPFHAPGLTSYWRFEDGACLGRDLCEYADMETMATTGGPVVQSDGKFGRSVSLRKGTTVPSALVAPAGKVACGTGSFSVSAWIRPNADSPATAYVLVNRTVTGGVPNAWTGAAWNGWHVRFWNAKLAIGYTSSWTDPGKSPALFLTGDLPDGTASTKDGKWHQIVVTRDAADTSKSLTTLYFDGEKIAEGVLTSNQNVPWTSRFAIGGQDSGNSFSGEYDEIHVYNNKVLSAETIAANYEATKPLVETRLVDEATARWTFDELVTEGDRKLFKDTGAAGLGCDFLNTANSSGQLVECVTGEGINGGAAYVNYKDTYLQLADGSKAGANLVQYGWPTFTISLRIKNVSQTGLGRNAVFCFGNAKTAEGCLRLSYEGVSINPQTAPQIVRILAGNSYSNGTEGVVLDDTISSSGERAPWTTYTFVNEQTTKTIEGKSVGMGSMKVYRDGVFVKTISTAGNQMESNQTSFKFDLTRLDIGYNTYSKYNGFMVDDLCVFRKRVLSDAEVKRLVREQAGATASPFVTSDVTVAEDATLAVKDGDHSVKSVSGAGEVAIGPYGTLVAGDWTGFTGSVGGEGYLVIDGATAPSGTVSANVLVKGFASTLAGIGGAPLVMTSGRVEIAGTGTIRIADAASGAALNGGIWPIAAGGSYSIPADLSGWTVEPQPEKSWGFTVRDGRLCVRVKGRGAILMVK